jgi:hypothetical protein
MKRFVLVAALVAILAFPAFSQIRLDLGADVPFTIGVIGGGTIETSSEVGDFLSHHILPFPEAALYYQFNAGPLKLAPGVRVFTFIFESIAWPNLMLELVLDPIFIQAQFGGLLFGMFGLLNDSEYGKVFFPDLSVWVGLGKERRFRLGAGVLGMAMPELTTEGIGIVPYIGGRVSLLL